MAPTSALSPKEEASEACPDLDLEGDVMRFLLILCDLHNTNWSPASHLPLDVKSSPENRFHMQPLKIGGSYEGTKWEYPSYGVKVKCENTQGLCRAGEVLPAGEARGN
ncbi:unnamed protein product [Protopolystoma xenopodis]|uniref:Uncharacterized protein n=1 Tax=Protopolystoma xenopodis TaxID=117903 RepID=A0A3S5C1S4_9PLAT|nr:unnamed protein product [Protopolystoma xenopodis]